MDRCTIRAVGGGRDGNLHRLRRSSVEQVREPSVNMEASRAMSDLGRAGMLHLRELRVLR